MFNNKRKVIGLEAEIKRLESNLRDQAEANLKAGMALRNQVEYLVRTIREMDDQIFKMSQCGSWNAMQPHFVTLSDGMTSRKVIESNRINDLIRPELIKTYGPKQIQNK